MTDLKWNFPSISRKQMLQQIHFYLVKISCKKKIVTQKLLSSMGEFICLLKEFNILSLHHHLHNWQVLLNMTHFFKEISIFCIFIRGECC